jgi:hypothetical protein
MGEKTVFKKITITPLLIGKIYLIFSAKKRVKYSCLFLAFFILCCNNPETTSSTDGRSAAPNVENSPQTAQSDSSRLSGLSSTGNDSLERLKTESDRMDAQKEQRTSDTALLKSLSSDTAVRAQGR